MNLLNKRRLLLHIVAQIRRLIGVLREPVQQLLKGGQLLLQLHGRHATARLELCVLLLKKGGQVLRKGSVG